MISYKGLEAKLNERSITRSDLTKELGISSRTIAKIGRGEKLSRIVMEKLCEYFSCTAAELCCEVSDNPILQTLREEKAAKISGGLYHELQVRMTYNSNHIEGSKLTHDQTRYIFETNTIGITAKGESQTINVDDIVETTNHFRCIDYIIDHAEDNPTEALITELHRILKTGTSDSRKDWFNVGDYKRLPNEVGGRETCPPEQVHARMKALLKAYNDKSKKTLEDIIDLHCQFERIHPFQDGNGRVGRLVMFKECLAHNIVPFIITEELKLYYYRGLSEWGHVNGYLTDTCLTGQDQYKALLNYFKIKY